MLGLRMQVPDSCKLIIERVGSSNYDYSFKVLLVGDSGVGKSSLLLSFISNSNSINHLSPTIGTSFFLS